MIHGIILNTLVLWLLDGNVGSLPIPPVNAQIASVEYQLPQAIDPLDEVFERLAKCESGNNEKALNPDDGGSASIGYVQFKMATFISYAKRYGLFGDKPDYDTLIHTKRAQKTVFRAMMMDEWPKNWRHWYNCWQSQQLPKEMPHALRSLTKN